MTHPTEAMSPSGTYRSIDAAVYCRPAGWLATTRLPKENPGFGRARIMSDEPVQPGDRLTLDFYFPGGGTASCFAEVEWATALHSGAPAKYEVGVRLLDAREADRATLSRLTRQES